MTHPNKAIREAVEYALSRGWRLRKAAGGRAHLWGTLLCPLASRDGHQFRVACTPRNPDTHAKKIRAAVDSCPHTAGPVA